MKLKDEFGRLPKETVYEMYLSLVYDCKDYDNVTRTKMFDEIIKEYNQKEYLYHICTEKELDFLEKYYNKKLDFKTIEKYEWEIKELNKKCIFSAITFEVFDEQKNNVEDALKYYKKRRKKIETEIVIFMISVIKINAELLSKALISMVESMHNLTKEDIEKLFGHPLFHFYCEYREEKFDFSRNKEIVISYRNYWEILEDINELRKEYGIAGTIECDIRDNYDIFYYGFPIRKEKVKKMYDEVSKRVDKNIIFHLIDEARVLNNRLALEIVIKDDNLKRIIDEALDDIPCAVMNGFTPNQYNNEKIKEIQLTEMISRVPQNNAHLCKKAADEFYKLYFALLEYINNKENISPNLKKIYKQGNLDVNELIPIDKFLWEHKEVIDEFIKNNIYNFKDDELEIISEFKNAVTSDNFVIVGFEREYTKILSDDGKMYMVKGIRCDLDKIIDARELPKIVSTTLLMFKGNIIFNSFFSYADIKYGNNINELLLKEVDNSMLYYHL